MGSGRIWVPKKSGFLWVLGDFGFPTTSLLMGSGTKKFWAFPRVSGFRVPEPITNYNTGDGSRLTDKPNFGFLFRH